MEESVSTYLGLPQFMWEGIFNIVVTLGAGLIIAFVTTFYLKKKDEVTRVAGLILEKRVNSYKDVLDYFDKLSQHMQLRNGKEKEWYVLLQNMRFELPHGMLLQYSDAFSTPEKFQSFFNGLELVVTNNKLWFDKKVIIHLNLIQAYFAQINSLRVLMKRIPAPPGEMITEEEWERADQLLLLQIGIVLDNEINALLAKLEVLLVDSVYHLNLKRPKKSLTRNGFLNTDMLSIIRELDQSLLGKKKEDFLMLAILQVYAIKGKEPSEENIDEIIGALSIYED
jgi:hypothetical protein